LSLPQLKQTHSRIFLTLSRKPKNKREHVNTNSSQMVKGDTNRYEIQASPARYDRNVLDIQTSPRRKSDISAIGLEPILDMWYGTSLYLPMVPSLGSRRPPSLTRVFVSSMVSGCSTLRTLIAFLEQATVSVGVLYD